MNEDARFVLPLETTMNVFDLFLFFFKIADRWTPRIKLYLTLLEYEEEKTSYNEYVDIAMIHFVWYT